MPHASILYAEDDALVRGAIVELLEDEGFVDLFLRKPEDVGRLLDVIRKLLGGRGA